ncbi:MAG: nucleoside triphosphate pyrophosphohydrolase family protein [Clostridiales bacterium]|nr:nucleoside triphosphate pyrophosphohydrolase family protein [Clostridiales bacterium]
MDFSSYQELAMRSASVSKAGDINTLQNAALGLAGEAGEFADIIKKVSFQGHALDQTHLAQEIGDILWYCALAATGLGLNLDDIAQHNIDKLKRRYPNGFEKERSVHRAE